MPPPAASAAPFAVLARAVSHHLGIWPVSACSRINNSGAAMFSSLKCNQLRSARDNLGDGKPQLTLRKVGMRAKTPPEGWHPATPSPVVPVSARCTFPTAAPGARGPIGNGEPGQEPRQKQTLQLAEAHPRLRQCATHITPPHHPLKQRLQDGAGKLLPFCPILAVPHSVGGGWASCRFCFHLLG